MGEAVGTSIVKSSFTTPSPSSAMNWPLPCMENPTICESDSSLKLVEFAVRLPDICNGPIIAIKMAKNRALRQDVAADMDNRSHVRTSNIPLH